MVKAVIFDLGGVIVPFDVNRGYAAMQPLCPYPTADIPKRIGATDLVRRFESGQLTPEAFVGELCSLLELKIDYEQFCRIWSTIFLPYTLIPESLLVELKQRHRLILLSNTNAIHWTMLQEAYPLLGHFDERVLSFEVGAMKPSPRVYQEAIARAACRPEECFFTDDILPYVEAARREGIDAVQFQSHEQLESELKSRGIL